MSEVGDERASPAQGRARDSGSSARAARECELLRQVARSTRSDRGGAVNGFVGAHLWAWLGPLAEAVRADLHLGPAFAALAQGDARAHVRHRAARVLARCSPATLSRRCSRLLGCGYTQAVTAFRLHLAREFLTTRPGSIHEVAQAVGYEDPSVFCHAYQRQFGHSPRQARASASRPQGAAGEVQASGRKSRKCPSAERASHT